MARKAEDSDDEFPNIAQLVKESKITATRKTTKSGAAKNLGGSEEKSKDIKSTNGDKKKSEPKEEERRKESSTSKLKKRILNPTSDNPLLLPVVSKPTKTVASRFSQTLNSARAKGAQSETKSSKRTSHQEGNSSSDLDVREPKQDVSSMPCDPESEVESNDSRDADSLSDFIVNDSSFLDEGSMTELPPSRPTRRLVRGRKPRKDIDSDTENLNLQLEKLSIDSKEPRESNTKGPDYGSFKPGAGSIGHEEIPRNILGKHNAGKHKPTGIIRAASPDFEDPFTLSFSPSDKKRNKPSQEARFITPPGSPEMKPKKGLKSPVKALPRIPSTPHRPSMDSFWQQDVINDWNDEYSPRKTLKPNQKLNLGDFNASMDSLTLKSPKKSPTKQDKMAKEAKKAFSQTKHTMAQEFLIELDNKITDGQISKLAEETGGVKIIWSKKLNTTAGRANWKRETLKSKLRSEDGGLGTPTYRHYASIELAEKVIDDEERLLNVIAHEFCHLANFMVSNIKTNPHGKEFKAWAAKCSRHFGHRGIEVTTKHSYSIDYKYVWECENCGLEFKRHSKSIDPTRHQCGSCKSKLVQTKPIPRAITGITKVSEYQVFVKSNMKKIREENPGSPQKDIMSMIGKKYQVYKASKLGETRNKNADFDNLDGDIKDIIEDVKKLAVSVENNESVDDFEELGASVDRSL